MSGLVYLNGEMVPRERAVVPVDDRGFTLADGVYEVLRACDGLLFEADAHLERLDAGLRALEIRGGRELERPSLLSTVHRLLEENDLTSGHATVYVQVTRGTAPRTHYFPRAPVRPTVYLSAAPFAPPVEQCERGAEAVTHPDLRWARCDLKTINLLPNVLAKQAAVSSGAIEAVLLRDGVVTEGSHTSVFGVVDGVLRTHPATHAILPGVTRALLLRVARERGLPAREEPLRAEELPRVEELFVCGTTMDVTPIVRLDGRPVADGRPGPVTRMLYQALVERIAGAPAAHAAD